MTYWRLVVRSLIFHSRSHLGTLAGVMVGSGILTGALLVGDSVRGSLRDLALQRLGHTRVALGGSDRFFRSDLAGELSHESEGLYVPVILLKATAATPDDSSRANQVRLLGVDERFWRLADVAPKFPSPGEDEILLNRRLMRQLGVRLGDVIIIRASRPGALSRETPFSPQENAALSLRLTVVGEVPPTALGSFGLRPSQLPPHNAFVHLGTLQQRLETSGRANVLLGGGDALTAPAANQALAKAWTLDDAELELRVVPDPHALELRTSRVFIEPEVARAATGLDPAARPILTYFVNALRHGDHRTPYSMVCAANLGFLPRDLADDEIVLNRWLADDLQASAGDRVELEFYALTTARRLEERTASFRVRDVVPLAGAAADPELMPQFPGVERAESTRDWDPSLPVSMSRIRPKDEAYWHEHKGTPKAFVNLRAGQALWTNRFGDLTAVRYPLSGPGAEGRRDQLAEDLRAALQPGQFGLTFEPVREQALTSAQESQDFGGLFIGFSFFLIAAALLLVTLLFRFGVERRAEEIGTLLALGFQPRQIRRLLLGEAVGLTIVGSVLGMIAGTFYARAMIHGLATLWRDAVGTSALTYHGSAATLAGGMFAGALVALITIGVALRKQSRLPARVLLAGQGFLDHGDEPLAASRAQQRRKWLALGCVGLGLVLALQALLRGDIASAGTFFGAGALVLTGGANGCAWLLSRLNKVASSPKLSTLRLGIRNTGRRRGRSLAVLALLAGGCFLIASIGVFRLDAVRDAANRSSGTGGFALIGEATFPVVQDLNSREGREFFALDDDELSEVRCVSFRVRDGDEASCLNLNRAHRPRLLGVNAEQLAERGAFSFAKVAKGLPRGEGWRLLQSMDHDDDGTPIIPAVGDLNSILWAMGRKVGDVLDYEDERGRPFRVRIVGGLANSILQGNLIIDERAFLQTFPSEPGFRMFLVDVQQGAASEVAGKLTRGLRDSGVEFTRTVDRLNAFNAVQNTYLGTFQLLGGLGLILGSLGLGVVVLRNVLERRGELALLLAVGYERPVIGRVVLVEHAGLLIGGLILGMVAAAVAVLPNLLSPTSQVPYLSLSLTIVGLLVSGLLWTWIATRRALRGRLLDGLRNE